jgi:universal stress protein A
MTPKRILLCVDFSRNSQIARQTAASYVRLFNAELFVLHVINTRYLKHPALVDLPVYEDAYESVEQNALNSLDRLKQELVREFPNVTVTSRVGVPSLEIVDYAKEQGIDLIVMGTHGRTGVSHLMLGSTAEQVLRSAVCPVLTIRSDKE